MKAIIYSKPTCPACSNAKSLLESKGIKYEDRPVGLRYTGDQVRSHCKALNENATPNTVPQIIFVDDHGNETYIGGYTDLVKHNL